MCVHLSARLSAHLILFFISRHRHTLDQKLEWCVQPAGSRAHALSQREIKGEGGVPHFSHSHVRTCARGHARTHTPHAHSMVTFSRECVCVRACGRVTRTGRSGEERRPRAQRCVHVDVSTRDVIIRHHHTRARTWRSTHAARSTQHAARADERHARAGVVV